MADNKIEILTSNAKQVINDYVLGTDTDFQKVENAIQELAENDISTLNWNSLENYPDRSHDYQFSYNNSDGTINIWDTESESYLSPSEFLLSEHSDRQMACDQYAQHRLQFLENTPEALRDCVSNIFQTLKDYHLDVTILAVPNKTGSLDGKDFFAFDVSGGREQIFHSQTGTSIGLKEFQETLEQLQFWDHEEDSTSDERINRILDAAADNPARLRMEVNFLFDDKIQPNGVDFDENASITWTIRGNHETETFILTRDPDTHEITAYEANHGVLNIEQLQEEASRIGVADVSLSNRVTSDEYTQLDHMQTMEKASAKATISAVTMERGLRGMGSLTWHMHGTNGQEDFSLDGNRDGSPIIRDKAGKEYDIDSMQYNLMTRAEVNLEGQLHLTQEKVEALEVQAEKIASSKGTSIEVEKGNLIQETFEKIKPYLSGLKELQGKMEGMQDRIGDSRLLRSNTFYQDYKMQYDFCAKKALDLGAAYGKDQVIKNYISNNDLRMDRQEYYKTNYYTSLEQRILSGGQEGLEKYETENGKSYTYGTKYDLSAWEKVGNFFASTIFRPYFRNIEKTIDRDPHAKVAYETVPAVEKPEENPVDTSSMVSGGAQGGVTTENQAADGMDSKNSEESGALADEKKAEEEQHMDLKDAIERENQDTKDDAMVAEQTRMESQDNDQDNMTEAANSKDNSESVVNGEEVHEIPESDVLETAEISSADEDVTADFEISQSRDEPESDSGAMPESLDVQDRQEELLIGSVGEDHSDSDSFSTADAKNDTFEPTTDDATLERGESQAESPTIGSENANSFHEEYKAQFSDCLNAANALDDVLSQAIEDVFSDENLGYMDIVNAAADAITDHYNSDTPYSEAAESSADLVYEVTDLDGKPMDNMDTMAEKLQQNGLSAEHVDHLYELASDRYASPEEPFEQPDPYEGFMDLDSGVTDSVDRVDMSQSSSVDAQQKLDFYEPNQFLDQMSNDLDSYVQAIEHAENIGTDVPDTALSDIVGSSFSVDSLKSAIDLMEAEVKSTADDDRDAQETMDTDPVLSEDIPESSIEPEVDDSLDADEWRRYL